MKLKKRICGNLIFTGLINLIISILIISTASLPVLAQSPLATITTVSDPGLVQQRLFQEYALPPKVSPPLPEAPKETAATSASTVDFILGGVRFTGNHVYCDWELRQIFKPYIGHRITLGDLQNLTAAVTKKYREAGYVLSRANLPPQVIDKGMVKVEVIEGYISEVKVEGNLGNVKCKLWEYGQVVAACRPFQIKVLERQILLMNDMSGVTVKSVITPSKTVSGAADLTLVAERKFVDTFFSYDKFGTRYIGPQQITSGLTLYNTLFAPGDVNTVRYVTVPHTSELQYYDFVHTEPLGVCGLRLTTGGSYIETHPLYVLQILDIHGRSHFEFIDLSYALIRTRTKNFYIHAATNAQDVSSTILGFPFYNDLTRSLAIGAAFDLYDDWKGLDTGSLDFEKGFDIFGARKHFLQSRPKGHPNFTRVNLTLARTQPFCKRFAFFAAVTGQYAPTPLLASQQFAYGGYSFGRGYDPSEIVGDRGVGGKAELRLDTNPGLPLLKTVQYFIFYDIGKIWNWDRVNLPGNQSAASAGVGARFNFRPELNGLFLVTKPLTRSVGVYTVVNKYPKPVRLFFQISLFV